MKDIHDIVEISEQPALLLWWQWALIGVGALLVLLALILLFQRKGKTLAAKNSSPLQVALQQLDSLDIEQSDANRLAVHLSLIVRQYMQRKFNDIALFETDEEFHARSTELNKLPAQASKNLEDYLNAISEHKYAPNPNHPAALESLIEKAKQLLHTLDSTPQKSSSTQ